MRKLIGVVCSLLIVLPLVAGKPSGGGGKPPATTAVTSEVHDSDIYGTPYRIRSDFPLRGTNTYWDGIDDIISDLPDYYELHTQFSEVRRFYADFGDPVSPGESIPLEVLGGSSGFVAGKFISKVGGIAAMTGVGSSITGGFPFGFYGIDGLWYQVRMNSLNEPGTGDATFTCTAVSGADPSDPDAPCVAWRVVPAAANGKSIGRLFQRSGKGRTTYTDLGDYYMTFEVTFTRP